MIVLYCNGQAYAHQFGPHWFPSDFMDLKEGEEACYTFSSVADAVWEGEEI